MVTLTVRRLRQLLVILLLLGTTMFFVVHLIPGNPAASMLGSTATPAQIEQLSHAMGLDQPIWTQYWQWLRDVVTGDLGESIQYRQPVSTVVLDYAGPTIWLALFTTVISIAIAVPLAVLAVDRPRSILARALTPISVVGVAIPGFWLALVLILLFAVQLRIFPVSGYVSPAKDPLLAASYLVLPVLVLVAGQATVFIRTLRESILGEMLQPYLRTARSKGASERQVLFRDVLPNALLPAITVVGSSMGTMLGGIVIIESIFVIPGLGTLLLQAVQGRDYLLVTGITLVLAAATVLINLVVDLLYVLVDPRVRVG